MIIKIKKILCVLFISLNILSMIRIFVPLDTPYFAAIYRPVDFYLSFFSIYQDWLMFAPNPNSFNNYVEAKVEYEDNSFLRYQFVDSDHLSFLEKYQYGEKFRKLLIDGVRQDDNSFMWRDVAKYVLRQVKEKSGYKIPTKVLLIRSWSKVKDPNLKFVKHRQIEDIEGSEVFFTYEVL